MRRQKTGVTQELTKLRHKSEMFLEELKKTSKPFFSLGVLRKLKTDSIEREIEHLFSTAKRREMEEKHISHLL